ncbi:MAG: iron-sulfur cluster repair di-iron protein [Solirubrobacterales bacterium]
MTQIDPSTASLGALVAERPACAQLFERLRLDYCCGGAQTLADACADRGLDAHTVVALIETLDDSTDQGPGPQEETDWRRASIAELCDHIVSVHHDGLRRELPRTAELLATVVRVHGDDRPALHDLQRLFTAMRDELEHHIELEERTLFPVCRRLETDPGTELDEGALELLEDEHANTGDALVAIRELAGDYDPAGALCGTHRALLDALRALEMDVHQHVHEENNVLFPRARALAGAADRQPSAERA